MARFRKIDPRIWNDAKFTALSNDAKLLFIYLLTSPMMTILGALPMRDTSVAAELNIPYPIPYSIRYKELYEQGIVEYDDRGLFWVKNFLKYNPPDNPKVVISWRNALDLLPECPLLSKVLESAKAFCNQRGSAFIDAFSNSIGNSTEYGMPYGIANGTAYKEKEKEKENNIEPTSIFEPITASAFAEPSRIVKPKTHVHKFALDNLPDEWRNVCKELHPALDPESTFKEFSAYWTLGKGSDTRRSHKGWTSTWLNWTKKADEDVKRKTQNIPQKKNPFSVKTPSKDDDEWNENSKFVQRAFHDI